ncbi:NRT2 ribosyltransferase, partial [Drymodes brunneopygia]|nr:NRT2 ribosyltransferase [Drymodes brunneopygia]
WTLPSMAPLALTLALLAMTVATAAIMEKPLDMAKNSFDDQYRGCFPAMAAVLPALKPIEFVQNPLFSQTWAKATAELKKKVSYLPSEQAIALMAYTTDDLYKEFNEAVLEAGRSPQEYRKNFHFKTLHFLLTQALVTLRGTQGQKCYDVSRGVDGVLFKAQRGDTVRFGQFASASQSKTIAEDFGTDTVFQVHTCHGADIEEFSMFPDEEEVLIPPFETFEVTDVTYKGNKAQISLRSTGTFSNYSCEWLGGDVTGVSQGGG